MDKQDLLNRLTVNPQVMVGKPTIRIAVEQILKALAGGISAGKQLENFLDLQMEDIHVVCSMQLNS